ncbi:MAG: hypothetical protein V5B44_14910 [Candidatus Accumulibacter necessarius]
MGKQPLCLLGLVGLFGSDYHTRDGLQIKAVRAMVERLAAPRQP